MNAITKQEAEKIIASIVSARVTRVTHAGVTITGVWPRAALEREIGQCDAVHAPAPGETGFILSMSDGHGTAYVLEAA